MGHGGFEAGYSSDHPEDASTGTCGSFCNSQLSTPFYLPCGRCDDWVGRTPLAQGWLSSQRLTEGTGRAAEGHGARSGLGWAGRTLRRHQPGTGEASASPPCPAGDALALLGRSDGTLAQEGAGLEAGGMPQSPTSRVRSTGARFLEKRSERDTPSILT